MPQLKSGGAHIYFFIEGWICSGYARQAIPKLRCCFGLRFGRNFPKQEKLLVERGDVRNFINLPYFGGDRTLRPAYNSKAQELSLEEFLDFVDEQTIRPEKFMGLQLGSETDFLPECPPCLVKLTNMGIGEGNRNETMFNVGVMYQKMDPDNWRGLLEQHNVQYVNPPLPASEIVQIQDQLTKKEYQYGCKKSPLKDYCNKSLCLTKAYGVGNGSLRSLEITGIELLCYRNHACGS